MEQLSKAPDKSIPQAWGCVHETQAAYRFLRDERVRQGAETLGYMAARGHAFLHRELYLSQDGCDDPVRRSKAKIPETVQCATKPQPALPMHWVVGDSTSRHAPTFREAIAASGQYSVLEIPKAAQGQVGTAVP